MLRNHSIRGLGLTMAVATLALLFAAAPVIAQSATDTTRDPGSVVIPGTDDIS